MSRTDRGARLFWRRLMGARKRAVRALQYPLVWAVSRLLPKSWFRGPFFYVWQRHGVHVHRVHYYSPLPDTRALAPELFEARPPRPTLDLREDAQLELLDRLAERFGGEWGELRLDRGEDPLEFSFDNSSFRAVDGEILHGLLRELGPRRMIEIGSGHSTLLSAAALRRNEAEGCPCEFTAVEPYPDKKLRRALDRGLPGLSKVIQQPIQELPLETFEALASGDVLFIDSTHIVRTGSDVNFEFLEILPRLAVGVWIHIHDIFLPDEYPRQWLEESVHFFNEQYLLEAFLAFNPRFQIEWTSHYMSRRHPERFREAFPSFATGRWPGGASVWISRIT